MKIFKNQSSKNKICKESSLDVFYKWSSKQFMSAQDLPSILVPLVGLVFPAVAMASLFLYVEKEEIN